MARARGLCRLDANMAQRGRRESDVDLLREAGLDGTQALPG
jgi:hypothetical protein